MTGSASSEWLARFNDAGAAGLAQVEAELGECCRAPAWIAALLAERPYADAEELFLDSDVATMLLDADGLAQALAGHPRIGQQGEHHAIDAPASWSAQEQAGVATASATTREQIAAANAEYEQRFGHVYLVSATGKSAAELLAICRARLANDDATEDRVVREELAKIARIRLARLLYPEHSETVQ
jgi:2-oxo-4-hydroxy-4-carboxy-5-ureidoimidazoline decarboxylase